MAKAQMTSVGTALTEQVAMIRVAGTLGKSTEVMQGVNKLMKIPELQKSMMEMSKGESKKRLSFDKDLMILCTFRDDEGGIDK